MWLNRFIELNAVIVVVLLQLSTGRQIIHLSYDLSDKCAKLWQNLSMELNMHKFLPSFSLKVIKNDKPLRERSIHSIIRKKNWQVWQY